jgi:hypothetical protein
MKKIYLILFILITLLFTVGCATLTPIEGPPINNIKAPSALPANAPGIISAETDSESDLRFYSHGRGSRILSTDSYLDWRAPEDITGDEDTVTITLEAENNQGQITTTNKTSISEYPR